MKKILLALGVVGIGFASVPGHAGPLVRDHRGGGFPPFPVQSPIVRDHRNEAGSGQVVVRDPIVRDHRDYDAPSFPLTRPPVVRDHRGNSGPFYPPVQPPVVRDHRNDGRSYPPAWPPVVRDHRGSTEAAQGGVTVTSGAPRRAPSRCIRSIFGGPCVGVDVRF